MREDGGRERRAKHDQKNDHDEEKKATESKDIKYNEKTEKEYEKKKRRSDVERRSQGRYILCQRRENKFMEVERVGGENTVNVDMKEGLTGRRERGRRRDGKQRAN